MSRAIGQFIQKGLMAGTARKSSKSFNREASLPVTTKARASRENYKERSINNTSSSTQRLTPY